MYVAAIMMMFILCRFIGDGQTVVGEPRPDGEIQGIQERHDSSHDHC